jgi:hypothetical protein
MPPRKYIDVARVKQLLESGCTQKQVADRLGFSVTTVYHIAKAIRQEASQCK